jgi:phosphoribosylpyrophosphate synthetase
MGVNEVIVVDMCHPEAEGFYQSSVPVSNLDVMFLHSNYFKQKVDNNVLLLFRKE